MIAKSRSISGTEEREICKQHLLNKANNFARTFRRRENIFVRVAVVSEHYIEAGSACE